MVLVMVWEDANQGMKRGTTNQMQYAGSKTLFTNLSFLFQVQVQIFLSVLLIYRHASPSESTIPCCFLFPILSS